ncbi:hypothetical protein JX265_002996 [Neoarthrinium moseri]|uniref:Sfi1 spindle body domain-containing protein n=1 Tax=Neoarthrinium moseri TaxID=1658444 RepID=A0A9P9WT46_9PEZI|nr:hypothetical protein JX265_002996 [Neoarthrinium moseri]
MATGYDDRPSTSGSSAASVPMSEQSSAAGYYASVGSSLAGDGEDYNQDELQLIFDTVREAQGELPKLHPAGRIPTSALFLAYDKLLDATGYEPPDRQKLDKLLFKIGGSRDGETLLDKFHATMARMNITIKFDANAADLVDNSTEDDFSSQSDHYEYDNGREPPELSDDEQTLDLGTHDYVYDGPETPGPQQVLEVGHPEGNEQDKAISHEQNEAVLEKSLLGFERHQNRVRSVRLLERWQERSSLLSKQLNLFLEAQDADFQNGFHHVVVAWNEIAVEVDEMPLEDLPANVYSKRIEQIAARTHEILATKNTLTRWRQCTRERLERCATPPDHDEDYSASPEVELRLSRLASRAHDNLMKSRAFTQWFNRASEEENKARIADMAHQMGLKSRAFGLRPKIEALAAALRERMQLKPAQPLDETAEVHAKPKMPIISPTHVSEPPAAPGPTGPESSKTASEVPAQATHPAAEATPQLVVSVQPISKTGFSAEEEDEVRDERTMLARRHILRMRFFKAWEDYTTVHTTRAKDFALQKAVDPWLERSIELTQKVSKFSNGYEKGLVKDVWDGWRNAFSHQDALDALATESRKKNRIRRTLKPWIAAARSRRKRYEAQRQALRQWYFSQDQYDDFALVAATYCREARMRSTLSKWRFSVNSDHPQTQELKRRAEKANEFRLKYGTLQEWKARARENAVDTRMKRDAIQLWRGRLETDASLGQEMQHRVRRVNLYYTARLLVPIWRDKTRQALERKQELHEVSEQADFDALVREAARTWRALAKQKRKAKLREAHLEVRRRVKKGMGSHCVIQWRHALEASYTRYERMNTYLEEMALDRELAAAGRALETWRVRAQEKADSDTMSGAVAKQKVLNIWREQTAAHRQLRAEADQHWQEKAESKALKEWKLSSLQIEGRRNTASKHLNKDRKLMKQGFETWYGRAADKLVPSQLFDGPHASIGHLNEDIQNQTIQTPSKGLLSTWRAAATGQSSPWIPRHEAEVEEEVFAGTPGRPHLFPGSFTSRQTTTPLAPIPQRQPWHGLGGGPGDSVLGRSAPGGATLRSARSRRNLRVSWAQ